MVNENKFFTITDVTSRVDGLMVRGFYGNLTLSFQAGQVILMRYDETVKPVEETPDD